MLFNSNTFLFLFLPLVLATYWSARSLDQRKWILVLSSYVFYGFWSARFAALMFATTSVDYFTAQRIAASSTPRGRRFWLVVSLVCNLGVLGVFKYYDFVAGAANGALGLPLMPLLELALPIGISFYTFESMSYTIDVFRGHVQPLRRFIDYANFVTMFPRLVAGPIVRYRDLAAQLSRLPPSIMTNLVEAIHLFTLGMVKKVFVADILAARLVDPVFAQSSMVTAVPAWLAALGYTVQLYMDFSGYCDMAVGLGLLLGLRLPRNFVLPYASANIAEFWRRWHISLSSWLRDYLYIPLGGNRCSKARMNANLLATMVLGGLWHGANWTFLLWGAFHGVGLALYNSGIVRARWLPRQAAVACTFMFVVVGWVTFRAPNLEIAAGIYRGMLGLNGLGISTLSENVATQVLLVAGLAVAFTVDTPDVKPRLQRWYAAALAGAFLACLTRLTEPSPFLYFQF
jgi:alginate O-acetyltransferase complex protein AlgI